MFFFIVPFLILTRLFHVFFRNPIRGIFFFCFHLFFILPCLFVVHGLRISGDCPVFASFPALERVVVRDSSFFGGLVPGEAVSGFFPETLAPFLDSERFPG
jgi:hypothetical protein